MVSRSLNQDQGFCLLDPKNMRPLPALGSLPPPTGPSAASASLTEGANKASFSNDSEKKIRKPYTITNTRENWTEEEHDKFLEALQLFDRDWKKIEAFVGSKTVIQIRSHAQKYFLKVQRYGGSEHIPPPRPKRKASHPYPKASKQVMSHADGKYQSEADYTHRQESSFMLGHPMKNSTSSPWSFNSAPLVNVSQVTQDYVAGQTTAHDVCFNSKDESSLRSWQAGVSSNYGGDRSKPMRDMPDFGKVYRFIGSIFEPYSTGHLQRLKQMEQVDLEIALYFMQNLTINLKSPEFENQKSFFYCMVMTSRGLDIVTFGSVLPLLDQIAPFYLFSKLKWNLD